MCSDVESVGEGRERGKVSDGDDGMTARISVKIVKIEQRSDIEMLSQI